MAKNLAIIIREVFYFLSTLWLVFMILEIIWPNIILAYFNLNYLLLGCLLSGLVHINKKTKLCL